MRSTMIGVLGTAAIGLSAYLFNCILRLEVVEASTKDNKEKQSAFEKEIRKDIKEMHWYLIKSRNIKVPDDL